MRRGACQHLLKQSHNRNHNLFKSPHLTTTTFQTRPLSQLPPHRSIERHRTESQDNTVRASFSTYIYIFTALAGNALLADYLGRAHPAPAPSTRAPVEFAPTDSNDPFFTDMPIEHGHRCNLSADQEAKLRELWAVTLKTFGVQDPSHPKWHGHSTGGHSSSV